MKVKTDTFLRGENLTGATSKSPIEVEILGVVWKLPSELAFKTQDGEGRFEIRVMVNGEEYDWLPNKTSLRSFVSVFGDESDNWIGKKIKMYSVEQNVSGEIKQVVYAVA